jgi:hypothetical protein
MTPLGQNGLHKGAREFAALGLWALAVYTVLSLASHDVGREPNLGGPLGGALARTLERAFGHVAYVVALLLVCLGRSVWTAAPIGLIWRYATGGMILLMALSAAIGNPPPALPAGATSSAIAAALPAYFNIGGLSFILLLVLVGALASLGRRARTQTGASSKNATARSRLSSALNENDDSVPNRVPVVNRVLILRNVHSEAPGATRTPEPPPVVLAEEVRVRRSRVKGAYRLPRLDLLDNPPLDKSRADELSSKAGRGSSNRSWRDLAYRRR